MRKQKASQGAGVRAQCLRVHTALPKQPGFHPQHFIQAAHNKHFLFGKKKFKSKDNSLCLEVEKGVLQLNLLYCQCLLPAYIYTI